METKCFLIGNQKGGVGKSTLTLLLGNHLNSLGHEVVLADADFQNSIWKARQREEIPENFKPHEIVKVESQKFGKVYEQIFYGEAEFVGLDMPGSMMQKGIVSSLAYVDVLFVSSNLNLTEVDSTVAFLETFKEVDKIRKDAGLKPAKKFLVFSRIDRRVQGIEQDMDAISEILEIPRLKNYFAFMPSRFSDVSTFDNSKIDTKTSALLEEMTNLIKY